MADLSKVEEHLMLAILRLHPNAYGVSIRDLIEERAGIKYSFGTIYAALERLENKGFINSREGEPTAERGGKRKLYFTINALGQATLQHSLMATDVLRRGTRWKERLA